MGGSTTVLGGAAPRELGVGTLGEADGFDAEFVDIAGVQLFVAEGGPPV
jgi:hypothetical protein